jgi:glutamate-5-semialdehyde dehydrogenase
MTAELDLPYDAHAYVNQLASQSQKAAQTLASASSEQKNKAIRAAAKALRARSGELVRANAIDVETIKAKGKPAAFIDRLQLDKSRIEAIAVGLEDIAALPDPVGRILSETKRPNGLNIQRVATPLGVIGMIYESRPNVGADAGALCLKSGNAVVLRCGSESLNSSRLIAACLRDGLVEAGLPEACVSLIDTPDRAAVGALLQCSEFVDLIMPRGGKSLVERVRDDARVPKLLHLDGNCHVYVHEEANLNKAVDIVVNSKLRRTGVCGAAESLVIDTSIAHEFLPRVLDALNVKAPTEMRGEADAQAIDARIVAAGPDDFSTEYLDSILSVKIVSGIDEALGFITAHHSAHTDAIITENAEAAERFLNGIDSAIVMVNASTQFADGGEFGMGAEIGIATGKMHARGPVGLEQLTSFKYKVRGTGQTRP